MVRGWAGDGSRTVESVRSARRKLAGTELKRWGMRQPAQTVTPIGSLPTLASNVVVLGALQLASQAILLLTLPYLARQLGIEAFGRVALAQVVMQYLMLVVDYGFNWSATQRIAAGRDDRNHLNSLFSSTLLVQLALAAAASAMLLTAWWWGGQERLELELLLSGLSLVWGAALTPVWLLHGTERMKEAAVIQLLGRLMVLPLLFALVKDASDASLALLILGGSSVVTGIVMTWWVLQTQVVQWQWPTTATLCTRLKVGFPVFLSMLFISFYTVLPGLALGALVSSSVFAHFVIADRVRVAVQSLLQPLSSALLPRMSHLFATDRPAAMRLLRQAMVVTAAISGTMSLVLFFAAEFIVELVAGEGHAAAAQVLRWMSPLPLVVSLSSIASLQVLLPNHRMREFNGMLIAGGVLGLVGVWAFIDAAQAVGVAVFLLLIETVIALGMGAFAFRALRDRRLT